MKAYRWWGAFLAVGVVGTVAGQAQAQIIADHTALAKFADVTPACVAQIKSTLRLSYGHTSHGSQIVTGMDVMQTANALYKYDDDRTYYESGSGNAVASDTLSLWDAFPGYGANDLGAPDTSTWATATDRLLSNSSNDFSVFPHLRNVVVWSWCGQASYSDIGNYTTLMSGLEAKFADVHFVYMTGHLDGSGVAGDLNVHNEQIRTFVKQSPNRILFDFADIESYDPDGAYYLDKNATDGCDYDGGNWATNWCNAHTGHELCADNSCAHSQPLNCNVKARAFWWLLSQIAGCTPGSDGGAGGSGGSGAGGAGGSGNAGAGGSGNAGAGGTSPGTGGSGQAGSGTGGAGNTDAGVGGAPASAPPASEDSGCSCGAAGKAAATPFALLLGLAAMIARRRRY